MGLSRLADVLLGGPARTRPGLRHFYREVDGRMARYHLRVDGDGSGWLIANASAGLSLSPVGVRIALALLSTTASDDRVAQDVTRALAGVKLDTVRADVVRVRAAIEAMSTRPSAYPLSGELGTDRVHRCALIAPLCADVIVGERGVPFEVLDRLWQAGVPHLRLVLPAGRRPAHLVRLVEHAEDLGMIAGVRGRATDLSARGLLEDLASAGLDHLDVLYAGPDPREHDGLMGAADHGPFLRLVRRARALEICPVAVVPIVGTTLDQIDDLGPALSVLGIDAAVLFAVVAEQPAGQVLGASELRQALAAAEEVAEQQGVTVMWAPPVERDPRCSLSAQVRLGPRTAGDGCIGVCADGTVVAPTGDDEPLGNLLTDGFDSVWAHPRLVSWRESVEPPPRCGACPDLVFCADGCPAERAQWAYAAGGAA